MSLFLLDINIYSIKCFKVYLKHSGNLLQNLVNMGKKKNATTKELSWVDIGL